MSIDHVIKVVNNVISYQPTMHIYMFVITMQGDETWPSHISKTNAFELAIYYLLC